MKKPLKILCILLSAALVLGAAFGVYVATYSRMDAAAAALLASPEGPETVEIHGGDCLVFTPDHPAAGLIFYPGGKVEYGAYAPLMEELRQRGILCVVCRMPCNLAVFKGNAADGVKEAFPQVERWYLGGHSLGGVMASVYAGKHPGEYEGLLLLAAYATADLSGSGLKVLSVRGSEDGVLNGAAYEKNRANLPADARELVIEGGCHAYFGDYGPQRGDGVPTVSRERQLTLTADAFAEMVLPPV